MCHTTPGDMFLPRLGGSLARSPGGGGNISATRYRNDERLSALREAPELRRRPANGTSRRGALSGSKKSAACSVQQWLDRSGSLLSGVFEVARAQRRARLRATRDLVEL